MAEILARRPIHAPTMIGRARAHESACRSEEDASGRSKENRSQCDPADCGAGTVKESKATPGGTKVPDLGLNGTGKRCCRGLR